jgi:hypothetical protein
MSERSFSLSKELRDELFKEKDDVTIPILQGINIYRPSKFRAVLMPSLYGPEVFYLRRMGVLGKNIFAMERDKNIHTILKHPLPDHPHLGDIRTTPFATDINQAIDHIPFSNVDLIYIDLFGQPNDKHLRALYKLFRLHQMLAGSAVILTYGRNRGSAFSCRLNSRLVTESVGQAYLEAAMRESGHRPYKRVKNHEYVSRNIHFNITEARF